MPIAGNYLDSILARLVDESLKNSEVLDPNLFNYRYPVVCKRLEEGKEDEHRRVIRNLWMAIRETKHQESSESIPTWGGEKGNPFCVKIGHLQIFINREISRELHWGGLLGSR